MTARQPLSESDLRLTAKAVRGYRRAIQHNARRKGTTLAVGRVAQLKRLEGVFLRLADKLS